MKTIINMGVIKAQVVLVVGNYTDVERLLPHGTPLDGDGYLARAIYREVYEHKHPFQVTIHSKSAAISAIAHEAVHAASYILGGMGVLADHENDELAAYIVQHICEAAEKLLCTYEA